jgi:hypothetical protein
LADFLLQIGFRRLMRGNLLAPTFQCPPRGSAMPVMIDDSVAEHPIKPRNRALFIAYFGAPFQSPHKRRLQNVLRGRPGFHPRLQKSQKLTVTVH